MHVTEETFLARILHFHWSTSAQSEKARVHLEADVFACTKCSAHAAKLQTNFFFRHGKAIGNLLLIFM